MRRSAIVGSIGIFCVAWCTGATAAPPTPTVTPTVWYSSTLSPLTGQLATPAAGQTFAGLKFYATDLGMTTVTQDASGNKQLRIIFGDSWADDTGTLVSGGVSSLGFPVTADDVQGTICLTSGGCPSGGVPLATGAAVDAYFASQGGTWRAHHGPPIVYPTLPSGSVSPLIVYQGGSTTAPLDMGPSKTPVAAFSNGTTNFALFSRGSVVSCIPGSGCVDSNPAGGKYVCDTSTILGGCADTSSSTYGVGTNNAASYLQNILVGNSDPSAPQNYYCQVWATDKFVDTTTRTVNKFLPTNASGSWQNDYNAPDATTSGDEKVFIWGRPSFAMPGGTAELYFAYAAMPTYSPTGSFTWAPQYYVSTNPTTGVPVFSPFQSDARPLTLGTGVKDSVDIVNQVSVSWSEPLKQWVMAYGGDLWPGIADVFSYLNNQPARAPNGSVQVRFAADPWGPWSAAQTLYFGGDPTAATDEFGDFGILYSDECATTYGAGCAPSDNLTYKNPLFEFLSNEPANAYGTLYGAAFIDPWTTSTSNPSGANMYFAMSTWNPYQVVLAKTTIVLGPFQRRLVETAVPTFPLTAPTGGQWSLSDHDGDGIADLVYIRTADTANNLVEVHIANGATKYQTHFPGKASNFVDENDGTWTMADYDRDGLTDLVFIKTVAGHNAEVHIASASSGYQTRILERISAIPVSPGTWTMADDDGDGIPDLVFVKTAGTPSGNAEVHVVSGASNYQTFIEHRVSPFPENGGGSWTMADYDGDHKPDLVFVKTSGTASGNSEVYVASGSSHFTSPMPNVSGKATTWPAAWSATGTSAMADFNKDGIGDLAVILGAPGTTPSGTAEVHIASGY